MCEPPSIYCPISGPLYRYIPEGFLFSASAPLGLSHWSALVGRPRDIQAACMDRAPVDAINSEPTMETKKISSLEAWERQKALLAKRKQKKNPSGYSRGIKLKKNEGACVVCMQSPGSPVQGQHGLGSAQAQPGPCDRNATACNAPVTYLIRVRVSTEPRRLPGGCLLYRFPVQLRSV